MVNALLCTLGLVATGAVEQDGIPLSSLLFWTGNVLGILIFTPFFLRISQRWQEGTLFRITLAGLLWTAVLCIVMLLGYTLENTAHTGFIPLAYLSFPLLVWLSYVWRRDVTMALALVTVLMTSFTATGHGPLLRSNPMATYAEMTIFIAVYAISCLILMAAVEEGNGKLGTGDGTQALLLPERSRTSDHPLQPQSPFSFQQPQHHQIPRVGGSRQVPERHRRPVGDPSSLASDDPEGERYPCMRSCRS